MASVPASIRSNLVTTASVLLPAEAHYRRETLGISAPRHLPFFTIWVDLAGHLQGLRRGHVRVGRRDGQDDAVGVGDVLQDEISYLDLDVLRLIADRDLTGGSERHQPTQRSEIGSLQSSRGEI